MNEPKNPYGAYDPAWERISSELPVGEEKEYLFYLYTGLIFPKEESLMLRCRMTGAELSSEQLLGLAAIADIYGGGYVDITTRANFQIREIAYEDGINVLRDLVKLDIVPSVKGLNNLRNITINPTSGFDKEEICDVMSLAKSLTNALLFEPSLQGLPGKFNIAIDSGGCLSVASEANDLGIRATKVDGEIRFRLTFANLKGEETVSEDAGWLLKLDQVVPIVSAVTTVFLKNGDFSIRLRSRLKFYVASVGVELFLKQVAEGVIFEIEKSVRNDQTDVHSMATHVGVWEQSQPNFKFIGINGTTGRYTVSQIREIAHLAKTKGRSIVRLTTKQTCLLPWIEKDSIEEVEVRLLSAGLRTNSIFAGTIVACTGSVGCSYSATDTKLHAKKLREELEHRSIRAEGVNIHYTGCPFSCAQTYIGDIGLLGAKVKGKECYHVFLGGGASENVVAKKVRHGVLIDDVTDYIALLLERYEARRECGESFYQYVLRVGVETASLEKEGNHV